MLSAVTFLAVFSTGVLAALAISGSWGFYLYQVVYFLNPDLRWWSTAIPAISYSKISVVVMLLAWFMQRTRLNVAKLKAVPQFKWLFGIGLMLFIVDFYAVNTARHHDALVDFWKLIVVVVVAYKLIDTEKKLEMALLAYIVVAFYIGWEAYAVGRNSMGRVEGIGMVDVPDANGFAAALVPSIPLLIYFFWKGSFKQRIVACALGVWIANAIVLINSRGAFLGVSIACAVFLGTMLFSRYQEAKQRLVAILIISLSVSATIYITDEQFWNRMGTLSEIEDESASGSHRYRMWISAVDLALERPAGVGAFGFQKLSPIYVDAELFFRNQKEKAVHSSWFQALSEIGWIGLSIFLALLLSCFKSSRKVKTVLITNGENKAYFRTVALESAFLGYLVAASFIDIFRSQMMYWLVLFFAVQHHLVLDAKSNIDDKAIP